MKPYRPQKIRSWNIGALILRGIGGLLGMWPLLLIAIFFLSPMGPHLRWSYEYRDLGASSRIYYACTYLGSRGFVRYMEGDDCPFIAMIDRRVV